ncbi:MAG: YihY/virulence factor BrkB family protein [Ktedonobacterales bacterium]
MAASASGPQQRVTQQRRAASPGATQRGQGKVKQNLDPLGNFWTKLNNDWVFNWSSMLAYDFLTSLFPILLVIIGIGGLVLGVISPSSRATLEHGIASGLPGGASGSGGNLVTAATYGLNHSAGALLILGVVIAIITGSGLFISLENVFGVIFRLRGRDMLHQRLMALGMLLLYTVLVPIIVLTSIAPPAIVGALGIGNSNPAGAFLIMALGLVVSLLAAVLLFGAMYVVVPNRPVRLKEVWVGTLVSAVLLVLYEIIFPIYESHFIQPGRLGATVGFAVVILAFFYYLAFILLLGAEINSWRSGQRQTASAIDAIMHELQAHNTTRGAAGPTAGDPREDLQNSEGASAMRDTTAAIRHERTQHQGDAEPPKYAESGATGSGYRIETPQTEASLAAIAAAQAHDHRASRPARIAHNRREATAESAAQQAAAVASAAHSPGSTGEQARVRTVAPAPPLSPRQRGALVATLAVGVVALAGMLRFAAALAFGHNPPRHPAAR